MPRVDLFTSIHKALRAIIYDTGPGVQVFDAGGPERAAVLERLERTLGMLEEHHELEERAVFPHVRRFEPEMVTQLEAQHEEVRRRLGTTGNALAVVRGAGIDDGQAAAAQLNRRFNDLVAYYLTHLAYEEDTALPATQRHFSDDELQAMQAEILGAITPDRYADWMKWMLSALNRVELTDMFRGMKATAPPAALEGMKQLAAAVLGQDRWEAVARQAQL
jgi:hemerythrin-like domain-containing protein